MAPKDIKITSPNSDNGTDRSHHHCCPAESHHLRCKGGEGPQEHCRPAAKAGPAPLSPPLNGTAGKGLAALAWRELALRLSTSSGGGGATAGTGAIENSWESATSQQAQDVDGQQLNSFTEMT